MGFQLAMFFGVPGTLGNTFKTLKGIRFSHFGGPCCRYDFQARSGGCFFMDFYDFRHFLNPLPGSVLVQKVQKWSMEEQAKKESNIFMQAIRLIPSNPGTDPMWSLKRI